MYKGKLIAIEGTDGCGKKTQSQLLFNYIYENIGNCKLISFPRYDTETGQAIKSILKLPNINLLDKIYLFAKDRLEAKDEILYYLNSGIHVICDRYIGSMIVYALAELSLNYTKDLDYKRKDTITNIKHLELTINKMPKVDLQINLLLDPDISQLLMNDKELDLNEKNLKLQHNCYQELINMENNNAYDIAQKCVNIKCFENNEIFSINKIHKLIVNELINSNIF